MLRFAIVRHQFAQLGVLFDRNDIGPRHHHVGNLQLAEFEQIGEHHAFLLRQLGTLAFAFFDHLFEAFAHRVRALAAAQRLRKTLQERNAPDLVDAVG
jgi:hypothetical protein